MDLLDDFILDDVELEEDSSEAQWDNLIQQIIDGNVVPVIGADMLVESSANLHQLIIKSLAHKFELQQSPHSFSELVYDKTFLDKITNADNIYYLVNRIFAAKRFAPSQRLMRLLSVRQFPFVLTTTFTPVVEQAMRQVWGDELRTMRFNNTPAENDDIKGGADMRRPTLYYMFGRAGEGAHKYVLTDADMLDFCSSWLSNDNKVRPKNLCSELKGKYLLMLGNEYSDWLFRFIWYSIRKTNIGHGMLSYERDTVDDSLINFLTRAKAFTMADPSSVIDQIVQRLEKKLAMEERTKFDRPEENVDVFISYSRSDSDVAERLYERLTAQGRRVWFDRANLTDGGNFMEEIRKAIRTARYFIPILSDNVERERGESHVYRNEWDTAIEVATSMGRTYIIPVAREGFDFYRASIPEKMQQHNAIFYSDTDSIDAITERIIHKMNQD